MTKKIPVIATIAIAAILIGSIYGTSTTSTAQALDIDDAVPDKSFILCAVELEGQNVMPQGNAFFPDGIVYDDSWTFALAESVTDDGDCLFFQGYEMDDDGNLVEDENGNAIPIINNDISQLSVPGPAIELTKGDVYEITLVNDKDNEHIHSIDQHALKGDEHVNSGPLLPGESKKWSFVPEYVGTYLYHCGANNLMGVWEHIANGMYGSFVVKADNNASDTHAAAEYSVQFADMYVGEIVNHNGETVTGFDWDTFLTEDNALEVTNGQAFNYAPFIGADQGDGIHDVVPLNPLNMFNEDGSFVVNPETGNVVLSPHEDGDLGGIPILVPTGDTTRWHINNPGPNQFLAFHFIAGQMDVRDGGKSNKLMTVELNEETWTVPPGSASVFDATFPSPGLYLGVTHKLSDVAKGGAFAVVACDVDNPENNLLDARTINGVPLAAALCNANIEVDLDGDGVGDLEIPEINSLEVMEVVNSIANPRTGIQHLQ